MNSSENEWGSRKKEDMEGKQKRPFQVYNKNEIKKNREKICMLLCGRWLSFLKCFSSITIQYNHIYIFLFLFSD